MSLFRSVSYPFYCIPIYRRGFFLVFSPSCKLIYWYSCLFFIILIIIFSYIFPVTYIYFVLVHIVEFFFCVSFPPCLFVVFNISLISTFPIFVFHNTLLRNFDSIPFVSFTFFSFFVITCLVCLYHFPISCFAYWRYSLFHVLSINLSHLPYLSIFYFFILFSYFLIVLSPFSRFVPFTLCYYYLLFLYLSFSF